MKLHSIALLLCAAFFTACSSTTSVTTADRPNLEQRLMAKYASTDLNSQEPAPPAEGPEDVPASGPDDVDNNPILVPSPLLRYWASSRTP
ncbi:MAG TPA: hypothetical protein VJ719_15945 [Chthoniobacterales bacterium]|nr:hypothetical protein [Chthoniobacterales bacterium]